MRRILVVLALGLALGGCRARGAIKLEEEGDGFLDKQIGLTASGIYLIGVGLRGDRDDDIETSPGARFRSDPESNDGFGVHLGYTTDWFTTGVLYLESRHRDDETRARLAVHQAYGEFLFGPKLGIPEVKGFIQGGGGIGGVRFQYNRTFNDGGALAAEARARAGVEIFKHAHVGMTGGFFVWGYPGETLGQGGFGGVEAGLEF